MTDGVENRGSIKEETWRLGDYPDGKERGSGAGQEEETAMRGEAGDSWVGECLGGELCVTLFFGSPDPKD